jgi:hypothetical protein
VKLTGYSALLVWADHADTISKAYSGTGALKTDFTRTGKRTKEGAVKDGINSVMRYLKNNFYDGSRQVSVRISKHLQGGSVR